MPVSETITTETHRQNDTREISPERDIRGHYTKLRVKIECPFSCTETVAYLWSLSGSGKKCDGCPAIHSKHAYSTLREPAQPAEGRGSE